MHILSQRGESLSDEMDRVVFEQLGPTVSETKKKKKKTDVETENARDADSHPSVYINILFWARTSRHKQTGW